MFTFLSLLSPCTGFTSSLTAVLRHMKFQMENVEEDPIFLLISAVEFKKYTSLFKCSNGNYEGIAWSWLLDSKLYKENLESCGVCGGTSSQQPCPSSTTRAQVPNTHSPDMGPTQKWPGGLKAVSSLCLPLSVPSQPHKHWRSAPALPLNPHLPLHPHQSPAPKWTTTT